MTVNQELLIEAIEKNAEIRALKEKLSESQVQEELESTAEESRNTELRLLEEKLRDSRSENEKFRIKIAEMEVELEQTRRIQSQSNTTNSAMPKENAKSAVLSSSSNLDLAGHKSSKRSPDTAGSFDESISAPLVKNQIIDFVDTVELAHQVRIAFSCRCITFEKFSDAHGIKLADLRKLLIKPTQWHLADEKTQRHYLYLKSWLMDVDEPKKFDVGVLKSAKNNDGSFETDIVVEQTRLFLIKASVGHEFFAVKKLCIRKNKFKQLMREPVKWAECSEQERNMYRCCYEWAIGGDEAIEKLKIEHLEIL
jgi:hypothetical protein